MPNLRRKKYFSKKQPEVTLLNKVIFGVLILILGCTAGYNLGYNARHSSTYIYVKSEDNNVNLHGAMDDVGIQCSNEQFQVLAKLINRKY